MRRMVLMLLLAALAAPQAGHAQSIRVAGSTTVKAFMDEAAKAYMLAHPKVQIFVDGGGSGVGAEKIADGEADIGMMSRPAYADEKRRFDKIGAVKRVVGLDGVVAAVSDEVFHSGVTALSRDELFAIWCGKITNWKAVGGSDRRILVVGGIPSNGTAGTFNRWLFGDGKIALPMVTLESNPYVHNLLLASDQAITYLPYGQLDEFVHGLALKTKQGVIEADGQSIRDGRWPMRRELVIWLRKDATPTVRAFADFLTSKEAAPLLQQAGYLAFKP